MLCAHDLYRKPCFSIHGTSSTRGSLHTGCVSPFPQSLIRFEMHQLHHHRLVFRLGCYQHYQTAISPGTIDGQCASSRPCLLRARGREPPLYPGDEDLQLRVEGTSGMTVVMALHNVNTRIMDTMAMITGVGEIQVCIVSEVSTRMYCEGSS